MQPVQFIHEDLQPGDDTGTVCRKMFHAGVQALKDTMSILDADAVSAAVDIIRSAKRVEIYGIGSSAPIAEDAQYRMLRIGTGRARRGGQPCSGDQRIPHRSRRGRVDHLPFRVDA